MATRNAYCVKCRNKKDLKLDSANGGTKKGTYVVVTTPKGRKRIKGCCPDCGTGMSKFI